MSLKEQKYFIQDTRSYTGNSVTWWCWDGGGYTLDVRCAGIYSKEEAEEICKGRKTDKDVAGC